MGPGSVGRCWLASRCGPRCQRPRWPTRSSYPARRTVITNSPEVRAMWPSCRAWYMTSRAPSVHAVRLQCPQGEALRQRPGERSGHGPADRLRLGVGQLVIRGAVAAVVAGGRAAQGVDRARGRRVAWLRPSSGGSRPMDAAACGLASASVASWPLAATGWVLRPGAPGGVLWPGRLVLGGPRRPGRPVSAYVRPAL